MKQSTSVLNHKYDLSKTYLLLSGLLLLLSPWLLLYLVTSVIGHHSICMSTPCWNDEIIYWHEVFSFSSKGFDFGYYSINELTPKLLSFGTHGFGTTTVYSAYAKILGWNYNSIVIANTIFVTLAFLVLLLTTKPNTRKTLQITLLYLTYTPLILYCSTSMSELMNFSVLIIYFTLLYSYINADNKKNKLFFLLITVCILFSFIRIIYIFLFVPLILNRYKHLKFNRATIILLIVWLLLSLILFVISSLFISPFPYAYLNELFSTTNALDFITSFAKHLTLNTLRFLYPFRDDFLQVFQRYVVLGFTIWLLVKSNVARFRKKEIDKMYLSAFSIIFLTLMTTIAAYDVFNWRDYRVIAPYIFGITLLLILSDKLVLFKGLLIANGLGIIILCLSPGVYNSFLFEAKRYTKPFQSSAMEKVVYTKDAYSKFENTLVVDNYDENVFLTAPAGIGVTFVDSVSDKLKSKYIYTQKPQNLTTYILIKTSKDSYLYQKKGN